MHYSKAFLGLFGLVFACFILNLMTCAQSQSSLPTVSKAKTYFIALPEGLDTLPFRAEIKIDKYETRHFIEFSNGGNGTSVYVYDSTYLNQLAKNPLLSAIPLAKGSFNMQERVVLDISKLKPGLFYVSYLSCSKGGTFPLIIK